MRGLTALGRLAALAVAVTLVVSLTPPPSVAAQGGRYFADPSFQRIWERNDRPVEQQFTDRSWTWGPNSFFNGLEPYKQGKNQGRAGLRMVQYFDKARMEVNDDSQERDTPGFITNGRLVAEMVGGKVAIGDKPEEIEVSQASSEAVAGDPASVNENAPSYASFKDLASLNADKPGERRIGEKVKQMVDKRGQVKNLPRDQDSLGDLVTVRVFEPNLKHNIPDRFWTFLTQTGTIYENARMVQQGSVFQPWEFVMGLPITEPYWAQTRVGGIERFVLVQLFERRVLTYTPSNRPGFEVEMGNVGQHYYRWRYQGDSDEPGSGNLPRILNGGPQRTALTATAATIEWTTSRPTTSHLQYGIAKNDLKTIVGTSDYVTEHKVTIIGLQPNVVYYWRVISEDKNGQRVEADINSFKTPAA